MTRFILRQNSKCYSSDFTASTLYPSINGLGPSRWSHIFFGNRWLKNPEILKEDMY